MKAICFLSFALICCSTRPTANNSTNHRSGYFKHTFLKKFKTLDLPCDINEWKRISSMEFSRTDPKSSDSLFTQSSTLVCYGMLADTSRFYTLIFYAPAATLIPVITTFDKTGERIYDQGVDFGCWDGGPYSYECDGQIKIDSKMNLNLEHVTTCFDCDSTSSKPVKYFEKRKGKIRNDGMIELEAIKR